MHKCMNNKTVPFPGMNTRMAFTVTYRLSVKKEYSRLTTYDLRITTHDVNKVFLRITCSRSGPVETRPIGTCRKSSTNLI